MTIDQTFRTGLQHHEAGRLVEAEKCYHEVTLAQNNHAEAWHLAGVAAGQRGDITTAILRIRNAITLNPQAAIYHNNLGVVLRGAGRFAEAVAAFAAAIQWMPQKSEYQCNLGTALQALGNWDQAELAYQRAVQLNDKNILAWNNLGNALHRRRESQLAIDAYQKAIHLKPDYAEAHYNLGNALSDLKRLAEAEPAYRTALQLQPQLAGACNNLARLLTDLGQPAEAVSLYRQAHQLAPQTKEHLSNLIFTLHYLSDSDEEIAHELRRFDELYCPGRTPGDTTFDNPRDPHKRLRIGYVSSDFWSNVCAHFILPLLRNHDHQQFEIFCYSDEVIADATTQEMTLLADHWRKINGLADADIDAIIRRDKIDLLVDLKLHTGWNQLGLFARKPAPLQLSWLGYPGTTGLRTIDYHITDHFLEPENNSQNKTETDRPLRLPDCFWCYDPLHEKNIPVAPLPAKKNGYLTFGCLNALAKVSDPTLALWRRVLEQLPTSRIIIRAEESKRRAEILNLLALDPTRIRFEKSRSRPDYLRLFHEIDIALDTFPYNGHTTTLDGLWMGVPTVTLLGTRPAARAGWSILSNLGLPDWVGKDPAEFVSTALQKAGMIGALEGLRGALRGKMTASALMDQPRFTRSMEALFRQTWHSHCTP